MKAWIHQDGKQVKRHGAEKSSWYVSWIDAGSGGRRCKSCGPGQEGRALAEEFKVAIEREGARLAVELQEPAVYPLTELTEAEMAFLGRRRVVYFIEAVGLERIKIGKTRNFKARLVALQTACPVRLRVVGAIPGGGRLEANLHRIHARAHIHGEWYQATARLRRGVRKTRERLSSRMALETGARLRVSQRDGANGFPQPLTSPPDK